MKRKALMTIIYLALCLLAISSCKPRVGKEYHPKGTKGGAMFYVPAGEFTVGCNPAAGIECYNEEKPAHKVSTEAFYIDKYEVTVQEYTACVQAGKCKKPVAGENCNWGVSDRNNHPINCINWNQAKAYCEWAGKRLPVETEWEKAARGTGGRIYPWGNQKASCEYAVMVDKGTGCGKNSTWPVGSKPKGVSQYGEMDMAGNVWEWISEQGDAKKPGPSSGAFRVMRGGSWADSQTNLRALARNRLDPNSGLPYHGVRCARIAP